MFLLKVSFADLIADLLLHDEASGDGLPMVCSQGRQKGTLIP